MSDEFIRVATKEINDELSALGMILETCKNDSDVLRNSEKLEQHMHKIKGLAPMMGKEDIGNLAKNLDSILKKMVAGKEIDGFIEPLTTSVQQMKISMDGQNNLQEIQKSISDLESKIVD